MLKEFDGKYMMKIAAIIIILGAFSSKLLGQETIQQTIYLKGNGSNSTEILMYKQDNVNYNSLSSNSTGFGIYNSNTGNHSFHISASNNVGIGIINATEKLMVDGNIRAREIRIDNGSWPDFVFSKSYKLPTLFDIERHIKEKGHLMGIPSAAEVKVNGVELGEMNAKLLQKVEELTLYLIELKKENQEVKSRVSSLEKRIKRRSAKK